MPDMSVGARSADSKQFLAGIAALLPEIRARAGETERLGSVPDDIIQALTNADVFAAQFETLQGFACARVDAQWSQPYPPQAAHWGLVRQSNLDAIS